MFDIGEIIKIFDGYSERYPFLVAAIDGRCASGKSTLGGLLQAHYDCNVIPMDHFFLRTEQRSAERLSQAGENIDHERFLSEVLLPLSEQMEFSYRPYDCGTGELGEPIRVPQRRIYIIEGSYSCNKALWEHYHLRIFLSTSPEEQLRRIKERDGEEKLLIYKDKWIPLEERYFAAYDIENRCDYRFYT